MTKKSSSRGLKLRFVFCAWLLVALSASVALAAEKVLYEKPSRFGMIVVSEDENGMRILRFAKHGARQSVVKPGDPSYLNLRYTSIALLGLALSKEHNRMLVVGLGGGSLPMFLRKHFPQADIDVVEIDPDVVHVATEFFGVRTDKQLRIHTADGRQFIEQMRQPYDAVFLDAFGSDSVPPHLTTREFLRAVRSALKPHGVAIANVWTASVNPLYDSMVRTYQEVFPVLYTLDVHETGNVILLALPRKQRVREDDLAARARKVFQAHHFPFNAADLGYSFKQLREKNSRGRLLLDADLKAP